MEVEVTYFDKDRYEQKETFKGEAMQQIESNMGCFFYEQGLAYGDSIIDIKEIHETHIDTAKVHRRTKEES